MNSRVIATQKRNDTDLLNKIDFEFRHIKSFIDSNKVKSTVYDFSQLVYLKKEKINVDYVGNVLADALIIDDIFKYNLKLTKDLKNILDTLSLSNGNRITFGYDTYYFSDIMLDKFTAYIEQLNEILSTRDVEYK